MSSIEIRKLTPDMAEAYVHFFDVTPHDDHTVKDELPCYCITWRSDASYASDARHWFPTREERRARALEYVRDGSLQGYLAYLDGEVVGWCNATAECQGGVSYLRDYWPIAEYDPGTKVESIFCFTIAPKIQRMGVATQLLEAVCKDAAEEGFDYAEGYASALPHDHECRGPKALYARCGFLEAGEKEGRIVMRKALGK